MSERLDAWRTRGFEPLSTSIHEAEGSQFALLRDDEATRLLVVGEAAETLVPDEGLSEASGSEDGRPWRIGALNAENAALLMRLFPWTRPVRRDARRFSYGMGDRIDRATSGQIRAVRPYDVFPIFAQQSIRELDLTRRSFPDVVAAAAFAVFAEDYRTGWGADGDHLKTLAEIDRALDAGCTMITLDCSEHIDAGIAQLNPEERQQRWQALPAELRDYYIARYADRDVPFIGHIPRSEVERTVLVFHRAIAFAREAWAHIEARGAEIDFELSIDETRGATTPLEHYLVARELDEAGLKLSSVAPHFTGEFEKGLDYIGDVDNFRRELEDHQAIAEIFGYRLSLHSGSDKFSVFGDFGAITGGAAHVKTAGTNWLEALRVLALHEHELFRRTMAYAIEARPEAERYYHVTTRVQDIPALADVDDAALVELVDLPASRQTLHITYGLLLDQPWFHDAFFRSLHAHEASFNEGLIGHTRRHLEALGLKPQA